MMTPEEFFDKITHIVDDARTPDQSKEWCDIFFQAIQEYYRLKCLEAIRNTIYKCENIIEEWTDIGNPNIKIALTKIEDIEYEKLLPTF